MLSEALPKTGLYYNTWDGFKRDLERTSGHFLPVDWWLRVKPKNPLPWTNLDMQNSLAGVARITKESW
jgi:hypothetical protein